LPENGSKGYQYEFKIFNFFGLVCLAACSTGKGGTVTPPPVVAESEVIPQVETKDKSIVYFTTDISPTGLTAIYEALGRKASGKVAVKISTGEPGGHHFLSPDLIKDLVQSVNGTIVESNTASWAALSPVPFFEGRINTALHRQVAVDHGFTAIAPVDILDEDGSVSLAFANGKHITEDFVGSHFANYDSYLVLSHFKGHLMGGFGGALKNISIGIASSEGKVWIHTGGVSKTNIALSQETDQNVFLESMAEAAGAVINYMGENVMYINVMNYLSIDCDCGSNPAPPKMDDFGILGSLDPVALDKACVDLIYTADTQRSASLRERIESRNGTHILDYAESLGLGGKAYELVRLN
jgi:uncharacterized Fe-S center protein